MTFWIFTNLKCIMLEFGFSPDRPVICCSTCFRILAEEDGTNELIVWQSNIIIYDTHTHYLSLSLLVLLLYTHFPSLSLSQTHTQCTFTNSSLSLSLSLSLHLHLENISRERERERVSEWWSSTRTSFYSANTHFRMSCFLQRILQ